MFLIKWTASENKYIFYSINLIYNSTGESLYFARCFLYADTLVE